MSTHNIYFYGWGDSNEYPQHMFLWRNGEAILMSTHNMFLLRK